MRVGAHDRGHAAVQVPPHRHLFARGLGVEVHNHKVGFTGKPREDGVHRRERVVDGFHKDAAQEAYDAHAFALAATEHRESLPRRLRRVVGRPQYPRVRLQQRQDLFPLKDVVPGRDAVHPAVEERLHRLRRQTAPARDVLRVHDHEREVVLADEPGHQFRDDLASRPPHYVP